MSEILGRLRHQQTNTELMLREQGTAGSGHDIWKCAADEIERLRAELERLRKRVYQLEAENEADNAERPELIGKIAEQRAEIERLRADLEGSINRNNQLLAKLADIQDAHDAIMAEDCGVIAGEVHCTCVPILRDEIERLRAERDEAREVLRLYLAGDLDWLQVLQRCPWLNQILRGKAREGDDEQ